MFETYTFDYLLEDALSRAPSGVDTRQGSIYYDAIAGQCELLAKVYAEMKLLSDYISLDTATGSELDKYSDEQGLTRLSATASKYKLSYTGTQPSTGDRFFIGNLFFVYAYNATDGYHIISEKKGAATANVTSGTTAVPVTTIEGLTSATVGSRKYAGIDEETDSALRSRIKEKIRGPSENGNRSHYKTWCESVTGVKRARIVSLWDGANTAAGVLLDSDGRAASATTVAAVQSYVDPGAAGLGEGVANIGCAFTAKAAVEVAINVSVAVELATGKSQAEAKAELTTDITAFLKTLALDTAEGTAMVVRLSGIGNVIATADTIADYSSLTLNGSAANIAITNYQVAVLGTITFSAVT